MNHKTLLNNKNKSWKNTYSLILLIQVQICKDKLFRGKVVCGKIIMKTIMKKQEIDGNKIKDSSYY